jgi:hypothetical protein
MKMIEYLCIGCGNIFQRKSTRPPGKFCTKHCYQNHTRRISYVENDKVLIPATMNKYVIIDSVDRDLENFNWSTRHNKSKANENWYVGRRKNKKLVHMHRVIMERILGRELFTNEYVDHIDHNGLNNGRSNLRLATFSENLQNKRKCGCMNGKNTSSKFKGVNWHSIHNRWMSRIKINGIRKSLGSFKIEKDAAIAYNNAAIEYFGEFAQLNEVL